MRLCSRSILAALLLGSVALTGKLAMAQQDALPGVVNLFDRQEYDEARRVLEGIPDSDRATGQALYYLGRLDLIDGDSRKAEEHFEQAIEASPEQSEYHHWLAVAIMRGMAYRGFLSRMTGSMKMLKELRKAIELDPASLRPRMTLYQIMVRSYDRGVTSKADLVEQAEAIAGIDSVMGYVARGTLYQFVDDDRDEAGAVFKRAYNLAPTNRAAAISYADYLWEIGDKDAAIRVLNAYVEMKPDDKTAHFNLGMRTILRGGDHAGAKGLFEKCLGLKSDTGMPTEAMLRWCLGLACHLLGEGERAQAEWSAVYELDPDFDSVLEAAPEMSELDSLPR
jgi:tetratricopeptide (TPR) repeat protein